MTVRLGPMRYLLPLAIAFASILKTLPASAQPAPADPCTKQSFENGDYIVCDVKPENGELRLFWQNERGDPYRYFAGVAEAVAKQGKVLAFALNAGMYKEDFSPMGLFVENGEQRHAADTSTREGSPGQIPNFYKNPNGVFFISETGAGILPTNDYLGRQPKARLATQSGPMLVIGNKINPIFIVGSTDRTRRSGVGVCADGAIRFAISEDRVNFHDFARLFREHLQCPDALFLDGGNGAGLYSPTLGRADRSWHGGYGPIFGLVR